MPDRPRRPRQTRREFLRIGGSSLLGLGLTALPTFAILAAPRAQTPTVHVARNGDDATDGTSARPVRSLTRAQELARERRAARPGADLEVVLHGGSWRIDAPLQFGPADGGDAEHAVTWRAAGDGPVAISGGREISGWTVHEDGNWSTTVEGPWRFRELFVDGARRTPARHPDTGYLRVVKAAADRRTGFTFAAGDLHTVPDLDQVELVFFHDWSISRIGVASIDEAAATLTTTDPIGGNAPHYAIDNFEPHPRYFLEGSRSFLDQPGEWHLDQQGGVLTYRPMPGEEPGSVEVVAPFASGLLEVRGDGEAPVRNLHFVDLTFEHSAWDIPAHGYAEGQANYHEPRTEESGILRELVPAALQFEHAEGCSIRGSRITRLGTGGVRLGSRCRDCALVGTTISDISSNGVLIGEDQKRQIDGQVWWRAAPEQTASGNEVRDCLIERCGRQFSGAVGIWVGFARGTRIAHNELRDLTYTGVSLGWVWNPTPTPVGDNIVEDNHIHHVMQVLSDGGGIYTLGRQPGTILRHNRIHDIPVNLGRAESNGMFLDEGTTDILIEDNVIWNVDRSPLRFHRATTNLVRRNLLVVRGEIPAVRYNRTKPEDIALVDNVVASEER